MAAAPVELSMAQAINQALADAMTRDRNILLFGEDIGPLGGIFRVTDGLQAAFGEDRVFDTPSAEAGIAGVAIGLAMTGFIPVAEFQFDGFSYPALDQLISHVAKMHLRTQARIDLPIVFRIPVGGGLGGKEHHIESPEAYLCATPGLKVVSPSGPAEAYDLLTQAIRDPDPVVFLEPKRLYATREEFVPGGGNLPMHQLRVAREGTRLSIVTYGGMVPTCLEAAELLSEDGFDVQVLDLRSLSPLDLDSLHECVRATQRAVVVHEAPRSAGLGAEIAARIGESCFDRLVAPVVRVTGFDTPYPPPAVQEHWFPTVERVIAGAREALGVHRPTRGPDLDVPELGESELPDGVWPGDVIGPS